jgi:hypothetical protein
MQYRFTCIVAGCTQSGKTVWVKSLWENAQKTVSPPPQRIIWCYGQWQPSYFDMMRTMPGIEFNRAIPEDIDNADYLDVSQRNVIVLDDLMAQSGKDRRIADLFTKGSHHRNLYIYHLYCPKYISSGERNEKYQSKRPLYRVVQVTKR